MTSKQVIHLTFSDCIKKANEVMSLAFFHGENNHTFVSTASDKFSSAAAKWFELADAAKSEEHIHVAMSDKYYPMQVFKAGNKYVTIPTE